MTQSEQNKKAIANIYAIEDAQAVCEAIGDFNSDEYGATTPEDNMEYTPDDLLAVNPNVEPQGGEAFSPMENEEMDEETQRFVVDKFAEMAAKLPGDTIEASDIAPIATVIMGENGIKQNVPEFLEKLMMTSTNQLSTQNVSEAQPNGAVNDETAPAAPTDNLAPIGGEPAPEMGAEDVGTPALDAAPGGDTEAPVLDTNADMPAEGMGAGDDLGDFSLDGEDGGAPADADADGLGDDDLGDLDLGDGTSDAGSEGGDDLDFGDIDDKSDDELDLGDGEEAGAGEGDAAAEPAPEGEDDGLDLGDDTDDEDVPLNDEGVADEDEPETESVGLSDGVRAQLESIRNDYKETVAKNKIRAIVESYQQKRENAKKVAQLESIANGYKQQTASKNDTAEDKMKELGAKLESIVANGTAKVEASEKDAGVKAQLESIVENYSKKAESETKMAAQLESIAKNYHKKVVAQANAEKREAKLNAQLESIANNYHASIKAKEDAAKFNASKAAALEAIVTKYKKSEQCQAIVEGYHKKNEQSLSARLEAIVANAKKTK